MKAYFLNLLTPEVLMKKLGIIGLIIIIPLLVLRLIVSIIFGSWTEMLLSVAMILSLLLGWDILNYSVKGDKKTKTKSSVKEAVVEGSEEEELDIASLVKEKVKP